MTSKLVVNTIEADTGISSVSFASSISLSSTSKFHFSAAGVDIGADTNINRPAAGVLGFNVNGAEKLRIDTNGHLNTSGIVTAANFKTGSSNLHSTGLTVGNNFLHTTGINVGTGATIHVPATNVLTFGTNSNERLRITSNGYVGVNETDPQYPLHVAGATTNSAPTGTGILMGLQHSHAVIHLNAADNMGCLIDFSIPGADRRGGILYYHANNSVANNRDAMSFYTSSGGTPAERLRIATGGQVIIGDDDIDKANGNFDDLIVGANASTTETHGITIVCGNAATNGGIAFSDGSNGGADAYRGMISYQHNDNHMQFRTNATERLRITSDGHTLFSGLTTKNDPRNTNGITVKSTSGVSFQNYGSNGSRNWRIRPDDYSRWGDLDFSVSPTANSATDWPDAASDKVLTLGYDGTVTKPRQPCFSVAMSSDYSSSTTHTANFDTERFDQGNNFNTGSNGIFTAPVTGKYYMHAAIQTQSGGTASQVHLMGVSFLVNGSVQVSKGSGDQYLGRDTSHYITVHCIRILDLAQNDTVQVYIQLHGTVSIEGSGGSDRCNWQGYLMA